MVRARSARFRAGLIRGDRVADQKPAEFSWGRRRADQTLDGKRILRRIDSARPPCVRTKDADPGTIFESG
jgi:hypothetical protein